MQQTSIIVENIKCGGCATSITKRLKEFENISEVAVDREHEAIQITHNEGLNLADVLTALASMGYPQKGENHLMHKAKSYVSCAIGKLQ
jgi:copper chaperone